MFTGLIEELGSFVSNNGDRYRFAAKEVIQGTEIDDSISVNGCCLTVVALGDGWWEADVVAETIGRTSLANLRSGDPVNMERAVRYSDRLGGHMVQGHVDGVGTVLTPGPDLRVRVPENLTRYLVELSLIHI